MEGQRHTQTYLVQSNLKVNFLANNGIFSFNDFSMIHSDPFSPNY